MHMQKTGPAVCIDSFRLDPALIRPGRVDMKEFVGHCSSYQLQQMFQRFYRDEPEHLSAEFAQLILDQGRPVSPALIQGYFMFHKDSSREMMKNAPKIFEV